MTRPASPIPDSYWIEPGRLCAGEYPYARDPAEGIVKLRRLSDAGIDTFIDLTEEGEYGLAPYAQHLHGLEYVRLSIPDLGVPTRGGMHEILDAIDDALSRGRTVYVHCYGGVGRAGTVIACHLVRGGASALQALASIAEWRQDTPDGHRESPETPEQRRFVGDWRA
jgi:Dual specificity phosphatase, catalytic domain